MKNLFIMFLVVLAMTQIAQAQFAGIIATAVSSIISLHSFGDGTQAQLFGETCTTKLKGRIRKLKWVWDSQFSCGGRFGGLTGSASGYSSRTGAVENAVRDFVNKGLANGSLQVGDLQALGK